MQEDEILKSMWYFWNHNFYNRTKPPRNIIPKKGRGIKVFKVTCHDCEKIVPVNESRRRKVYFQTIKNPKNIKQSVYLCEECYKIMQDELKKKKIDERLSYKRERIDELVESVEKFDSLMRGCEYNTCDILAAHRELLINDDNRLRTDFMLEIIFGEEKAREYLEKRKNEI